MKRYNKYVQPSLFLHGVYFPETIVEKKVVQKNEWGSYNYLR